MTRDEIETIAWLIVRHGGTGKNKRAEKEVVLSPLTDDTHMDEGDEAWPLVHKSALEVGRVSVPEGHLMAWAATLEQFARAFPHSNAGKDAQTIRAMLPQAPVRDE